MQKKRQSGRFAPLSFYITCSREMESRIFYPYLVTATRRVASGSPSDLPLTRYIPRCRLLRSRPSSVACTSSISLNCSSLPSKLYTSMRTAHPMYCVRSTFSSPSGSGTPRSYTAALCSPPSLSELRRLLCNKRDRIKGKEQKDKKEPDKRIARRAGRGGR